MSRKSKVYKVVKSKVSMSSEFVICCSLLATSLASDGGWLTSLASDGGWLTSLASGGGEFVAHCLQIPTLAFFLRTGKYDEAIFVSIL